MPPQAQQFLDTLNSTIPLEAYLIVGATTVAFAAAAGVGVGAAEVRPPQARQFLDRLNSTIPLEAYLIVGAIMFAIGAWGALIRRNAVVGFMCLELMVNAVHLS